MCRKPGRELMSLQCLFYTISVIQADVPQVPVLYAQRGKTNTLWIRTRNERSSCIPECVFKGHAEM
jgi:hypothetical protein